MTRSPVIVAGMHRSGTSLVASWLQAMGIAMGPEQYPPDENNPYGYFEDLDFLSLNRELLGLALPESNGQASWLDWGWTQREQLDLERLDSQLPEAAELIRSRASRGVRWGWKDPRTTLLLSFWDRATQGEARYVLVYRYPWDVADSMQRLGEDVFLKNPEYAWPLWRFYNHHLLDFYRKHQDRALLVSTNAVVHDRDRFASLLREKLGLDLDAVSLDEIFDASRWTATEGSDPLIGAVAATSALEASPSDKSAGCVAQLRELEKHADLPSLERWQDPGFIASEPEEPPVLSVIVPCFNHGQFLIEALASVERCAPGSEILVVDDGSTQPWTLEVLDAVEQAGYRVIRQENRGLSAARNAGIEASRGRYILPLDADNRLRPGFVEAAIELLDRKPGADLPEIDVVYTDRREFGIRSGRVEVPDFDLPRLLAMNYIDACAVYRKSLWATLSGYDEAMPAWEDWAFWVSASARDARFERLDLVGFDYRVRPDSLVSEAESRKKRRELIGRIVGQNVELYRRYLPEVLVHADLRAQMVFNQPDGVLDQGSQDPIRARDREIDARGRRIIDQIDEIASLSERIREQIDELAENSQMIVERDDEIARRCEQIRERDTIIDDLTRTLELKDQDHDWLQEKHGEIEQALATTREAATWLEEKRAESEQARESASQEAKQLREMLADREAELSAARRESTDAAERLRKIEKLEQDLEQDLERSLAEKNALATELEAQQGALDQVHSSRAWKVANRLQRLSGWLLPTDGRARRFVGSLLRRNKGGR